MKTNENKTDTDNRLTQISIEMDELSRRIDHVDHKHESQTNWNRAMRDEIQNGSPFGGTRRLLDEGHKSLIDIQDTQDCLLRQSVTLRRERSQLIANQNSDAVTFGN